MTELLSFATRRVTCEAAPFQVEGEAATGEGTRFFYFRYRSGLVSFGLGSTVDEAVEDSMWRPEVARHVRDCTYRAGSCFCCEWIDPREMLALARHIVSGRRDVPCGSSEFLGDWSCTCGDGDD